MTELEQIKTMLVQVLKNQLTEKIAIYETMDIPERFKDAYKSDAKATAILLNEVSPLTKKEIMSVERDILHDMLRATGTGPYRNE